MKDVRGIHMIYIGNANHQTVTKVPNYTDK